MQEIFDDNVLLEKLTGKRVTTTGIEVPVSNDDIKSHGSIVKLGPETKKKLKKGQIVAYASEEVLYQDKKYVIVKDSHILAIVSTN